MLINKNLQTICDQIHDLMPRFSDQFIVDIFNELVTLGAVPDEDDVWLITFCIQKVENHILNQTNLNAVPEGLLQIAADMVCGHFIQTKYSSGKLCLSDLRFEEAVKTVTEGDATVTFETGESDDIKLQKLIKYLLEGKGCDLICYRKMRW